MKTLTVRQPWAELILSGRKRYELRSWPTKHRGDLLIHAGSSATPEDRENCRKAGLDWQQLSRGVALGMVEVLDCLPYTRDMHDELAQNKAEFDEWAEDQWAFALGTPRRLSQPIAVAGKLGIWNFHLTSLGLRPPVRAGARPSDEYTDDVTEFYILMNNAAPARTYCYLHDSFEELAEVPYQFCYECGHVYNTPDDLRQDYAVTHPKERISRDGTPFDAATIAYCVWCSHNFL